MDSVVQQWLERAEYDLETAKSLFESKRYLYVGFMCQQAVEKLIKGLMVSKGMTPPFIHNLARLAEGADLIAAMTEGQRDLLADLNPYYIKARYGEYKETLAKMCSAREAQRFLKSTEEFFQWLRHEIR